MAIRECDCKEFQDSGHTNECNAHYKPKQEIEDFNNNLSTAIPEKISLYLSGIGSLARDFMIESNAKDFNASTTLEPKAGGMTVSVEVIVKDISSRDS